MNDRFTHYLKIVAIVHIGAVLVLIVVSGWRRIFRGKPDLTVPVEFVVEVSASPAVIDALPAVEDEPPAEVPRERPEPTRRKEIKRSMEKITRTANNRPPQKQLTPEEIQKLFARGAKPGDHTSVPDSDARYFEIVKRTFRSVWVQPSSEEAGDAVAKVSIRLRQDGKVSEAKLVEKTGNVAFDESVMQAVNSIRQVAGLPLEFLKEHEVIVLSFKVE